MTDQYSAQVVIGITTQRDTGTKRPARISAPVTNWIAMATPNNPECVRAAINWMASGSWPMGRGQNEKSQ